MSSYVENITKSVTNTLMSKLSNILLLLCWKQAQLASKGPFDQQTVGN